MHYLYVYIPCLGNAVAQHANVWKKRHLAIKAAQAEFQPIREEEVLAWAALIARWSFCHRSTCLAVPLLSINHYKHNHKVYILKWPAEGIEQRINDLL